MSSASFAPNADFSRLECLSLFARTQEPMPWPAAAHAVLGQMTLPMSAGESVTVDGVDVHILPFKASEDVEMTYALSAVIKHRRTQGQLQFLVVYAGYEAEGPSWQPATNFFDDDVVNVLVQDYCERVGVAL